MVYIICVKVVEKDPLVHGMLSEELERCLGMIKSLSASIADLPRGTLHERHKTYKEKAYRYYYLKYRDDKKSINEHVSAGAVEDVRNKILIRKRYEKEKREYEKRTRYLERLLEK